MPRNPDKRKCSGHTSDGAPCDQWAIRGGTVCVTHGGRAPQVKAKAQQRLEHKKAEKAVIRFGLRRDIGPHEALLESVHRAAYIVTEIETILAQIERDRLVSGMTKTVALPDGGRRVEITAARNIWFALLGEWHDRLVKAANEAIRCGVAERQVRIAEDQARQLASVVSAILTDLGHDLTDERTREVVRLRLVQGGGAT